MTALLRLYKAAQLAIHCLLLVVPICCPEHPCCVCLQGDVGVAIYQWRTHSQQQEELGMLEQHWAEESRKHEASYHNALVQFNTLSESVRERDARQAELQEQVRRLKEVILYPSLPCSCFSFISWCERCSQSPGTAAPGN